MSFDLLKAAKNGYYDQVLNLLGSNACDVNIRDKDKATPLYWSASRGHAKICKALVDFGCDVNASVKWGSTALHAAADRGHADCLAVLISSGADVQVQNERGDTALHLAAYRGFRDLVHMLVVTGRVDPFVKNAQSKTPLQEAQSQQHTAAAAVLQKYMESLGCHPFKSLQMSEKAYDPPPLEQPSSTVPQSWPGFQSPSPLHLNNLSQDAKCTRNSFFHQRLDEIPVGSEGRLHESKNTSVLHAPGDNSFHQLHVHNEPLENDDNYYFGHTVKDRSDQHSKYAHDTGEDRRHHYGHYSNSRRMNELSRPGSFHLSGSGENSHPAGPLLQGIQPGSDSSMRHHNGQDSDRSNKHRSHHSDLSSPDIAPPRHPHQRLVKHEDLTLFAESLQFEVVNLREKLSYKEQTVSDLESTVSALKAQIIQMQQLATEKQSELKQALAAKNSDLLELQRKMHEMERQNLCLQQAVAESQSSLQTMSGQRDGHMLELTSRVSDLERLNSSLQQLLVNQQATLKGMLASKDSEIAMLKNRLTAMAENMACHSPMSSEHFGQSATPTVCSLSGVIADNLQTQSRTERVSQEFSSSKSARTSSSVSSVCNQPSVQKHLVTTHPDTSEFSQATPVGTRSSTIPHLNGSPSGMVTTFPKAVPTTNDSQQCQLRAAVSSVFQDKKDSGKLDADGREWTVGKEFQLLDLQPVNCGPDGQRRGSCSLVFSIMHRGRKYMLKMLTNLINLSYEGHSQGRSLDAHLLPCFGAEFQAPLLLHPHPNIVRVLHHYQGDTRHFNSYLPLLVPPSLDVPVEMAHRTTFLVLEHYPQTLQSFIDTFLEVKTEGVGKEVVEQFVLQMVYQLLSAVDYLQRHDVVHRDIKADNVFLDWSLRPILGDFGLARTLRGYGGQAEAPFTDPGQVLAGNSYAWAPELCRWSRTEPSTLPQPKTLKDIYNKADGFAVARMFYYLFRSNVIINNGSDNNENQSDDDEDRFPTSTLQRPHYPDSAVGVLTHPVSPGLSYVLRTLVLDDPSRRPTVRQALCRAGVLLCKPSVALTSKEAAEQFCTTQLLALSTASASRCSRPDEGTLDVAQSVSANQNPCMADFLLNFSGKDYWESYTEMTQLGY